MLKKLAFGLILAALAIPALAQNQFRMPPDGSGAFSSFLRTAPTYVDARVLAANTAESHTIPTGAKYLIISSSCAAFYAKQNGTAAVPAADVTDGTGSELNPAGYFVDGMSTIGFISPTICILTLSFYK